jgi:hypothetical protein
MAHTDVSKTFVGVPKLTGGIWRYSQTLALPTDAATARPAGGIRLGGVSDDGVTWMAKRNTTQKYDWNGDKVRKIQSSKDDTFKITYIEFLNPNVISEVFGDANVTVVSPTTSRGTLISAKSNADVLGHNGYIVDTLDGVVKKRRVIADAQVSEIDDVAEKPGDWSVYTVTYDMFPDSQGNTSYIYYELADRIPTYTVAETGTPSGGTFTLTATVASTGVSATTTALAYNAASTAVDTALEALSTVGAGGATVVGSAGGPFTITLPAGVVLGGNGASLTPSGATVAVTSAYV